MKSFVRWLVGLPLLVCLPFVSLLLGLLLSPLLLVSLFLKSRELRDGGAEGVAGQGLRKDILFDRVGDVSKIYGCNTRNVRYRRGGPRISDSLLRWDPDQEEGVWNATEETELSC